MTAVAIGAPAAGPPAGDVVLRDGGTVHVRAVTPDDEAELAAFLQRVSVRARHLRYSGVLGAESLAREARRQAHVAEGGGLGLLATAGPSGRLVGHAEVTGVRAGRAEVGFLIDDAWQGRGLGTLLVAQLAQHARTCGIGTLEAVVLPENRDMLVVLRDAGFACRTHVAPGEIRVELATDLTPEAIARFEERDWAAAVHALEPFFHPRAVAVVGASRRRGTISAEVFHNLLRSGFEGAVTPVNPNTPVVQSVRAYASVEDVPGPVDLAVLVVPAEHVLAAAAACGRKGVRALVVISAGFAEIGPEGRARQDALLRTCRDAGMRLIGPNCMGIANTDPAVRLDATFAPEAPPAGRIAFMSQSGALGLAVMDFARALGLGLSTFASVGNKADVSGNDLLRYWAQDPTADVILLYLESFGNPRRFARIARQVARVKPIVAVKSGRSPAGARAAGSHTGALLAASDVTVDALFRQAGVIRTDTLSQMFDVATLLAGQPIPAGPRVAIVTNAGGPGILCADACVAEGLEIPPLAEATQAALRALLPREASVQNPVDMIASATAAQYRAAVRVVAADPGIDAVVVIFIPPLVTRAEDVAGALVDGVRVLGGAKPVLAVFMQSRGVPEALRAGDVRVPSYAFPEEAAIALASVTRYGAWRARPPAPPVAVPDARREEAAAIVATALGRGDGWLEPAEVARLLACYGLPVVEQRVVATAREAGAAAAALGSPVALKAVAPGLVHKTELGAVRLALAPDAVEAAADEMAARLRAAGHAPTGLLVQRMAPDGVEMLIGVVHDQHFGSVVACGAGGVLSELLKDVAVRVVPLAEDDPGAMLRELRTAPRLTGYRGQPASDVAALADAIRRVGALADELPQVAELDLNPVVAHPAGVAIVDARVRVQAVPPPPLFGTRA